MLTIKWIKTFFIFLCVVLLLGGSEAFGSITSTPNMIRMEVYLSQDGQLINGSRAVELELHETQADNTPLFTKNMGSINFVDGYAALMFDIPTRDIKHLEGPEKKLFIINVQKGDMSSGFDRIKMDVLSTLKSKTSESAESVNWNNITNFPCSILSSFSDLHPDCADSSSNLGAASGPSSVFGLQVDNTTGFVGVGIIPQTELHINGTITNVDMPMTPTTSVNHIVLTLENDQFKKVDLSQDANKYPRVDAAGSGIEYVNAADISIGNADLLDGVDSTSFLKYSEPLTITNNFTVTNNSELYVNKININQIEFGSGLQINGSSIVGSLDIQQSSTFSSTINVIALHDITDGNSNFFDGELTNSQTLKSIGSDGDLVVQDILIEHTQVKGDIETLVAGNGISIEGGALDANATSRTVTVNTVYGNQSNTAAQGDITVNIVAGAGLTGDNNIITIGERNNEINLAIGAGDNIVVLEDTIAVSDNLNVSSVLAKTTSGLKLTDAAGTVGLLVEDGGNVRAPGLLYANLITANIITANYFEGDGSRISNINASSLSISSSEIVDDTITNVDIHMTAEIATTKISGNVISINNHGLGTLATANADQAKDYLNLNSDHSPVFEGILVNGTVTVNSLVSNTALFTDVSLTDLYVAGNTTVNGTLSAGVSTLSSGTTVGTLTLADGSITDSNGTIDFGTDTLTTTGTLNVGVANLATGSTVGTLTLADGSITDSGATINFGTNDLITTGRLSSDTAIVTGLLNANGGIAVNDFFTVAQDTGSTSISGTLGVVSDTTITGNLSVGSDAMVGGTLGVVSDVTITGNLAVISNATVSHLVVEQVTTLNGHVSITGDNHFTVGTGETTLGGGLIVNDTATLNGHVSITGVNNFTVGTGSTSLGGELTVTGNASLFGNVGIGTTSSSTELLHVSTNVFVIQQDGRIGIGTSNVLNTAFTIDSVQDNLLDLNNDGISRFKVHSEGYAGINGIDVNTILSLKQNDTTERGLIKGFALDDTVSFHVNEDGHVGIFGDAHSSVAMMIHTPPASASASFSGNLFQVGGNPGDSATLVNNSTYMSLDDSGVFMVQYFTESSDQRWKQNIQTLDGILDQIHLIRGVSYDLTSDLSRGTQIGVIAQEIEAVFPELVHTNKDGYKSVAYTKLTPILVQGIKELRSEKDQQINELKLIIESLTERIELLEGQ